MNTKIHRNSILAYFRFFLILVCVVRDYVPSLWWNMNFDCLTSCVHPFPTHTEYFKEKRINHVHFMAHNKAEGLRPCTSYTVHHHRCQSVHRIYFFPRCLVREKKSVLGIDPHSGPSSRLGRFLCFLIISVGALVRSFGPRYENENQHTKK